MRPKLKIRLSLDDGVLDDLEVADWLSNNGFKGIFFIPSSTGLTEHQIKVISDHHEIGGHTVSHYADLKQLDAETLHEEINDNRQWLRHLTGQEIDWFAYPRGRYNELTIAEVERCGFKYARTTLVRHTDCPEPYRQHTSAQVFQRNEYNGIGWYDFATSMAIAASETDTMFHLFWHSDEIMRIGEWENLKRFLLELKDKYELIKQ